MSPASPPSSHWKLKPLHLSEFPEPLEVSGPLTVGRDAGNDLRLAQDEVSSHHVRFEPEGSALWVVDLGSTNGTLVNGSAITRHRLASGDTVQLGSGGPRLVALDAGAIHELTGAGMLGATKVVRAPRRIRTASPSAPGTMGLSAAGGKAGSTAVLGTAAAPIRPPLATSDGAPRAGMLMPGPPIAVRKTLWVAVSLFTVLLMGAAAGVVYLERSGAERERLEGVSSQIQRKIEEQLDVADRRLDEQAQFWARQRETLEEERDALLAQIDVFEVDGRESRAGLEELREQLDATQLYLEMYDPVGLEQKRLADVSSVRRAVVLIEKKVVYRDGNGGQLLYFDQRQERDDALNLESRGEPLTLDASTGSGFCIHPDGWIVTNAHVLEFATTTFPIHFEDDVQLVSERRLDVVFSNSSVRHPATVVRVAAEKDKDLALLKIEPFDGMPSVPSLDLELEPPAPGSDVYLFGFPLGHHALQVGDTVIASTFRGILSRKVHPFLQVDAGVYPGNSGGPLTDAQGRVIGIIFSVQNNLDGTTAANIGYAIPISELAAVWPPDGLAAAGSAPR